MIKLLPEMLNLRSVTMNIDTKQKINYFCVILDIKMTQNDKLIFWCCFGDKK